MAALPPSASAQSSPSRWRTLPLSLLPFCPCPLSPLPSRPSPPPSLYPDPPLVSLSLPFLPSPSLPPNPFILLLSSCRFPLFCTPAALKPIPCPQQVMERNISRGRGAVSAVATASDCVVVGTTRGYLLRYDFSQGSAPGDPSPFLISLPSPQVVSFPLPPPPSALVDAEASPLRTSSRLPPLGPLLRVAHPSTRPRHPPPSQHALPPHVRLSCPTHPSRSTLHEVLGSLPTPCSLRLPPPR